jgi:hypothetical protein
LQEARSRYINFPAAQASPVVLRGDEVSGTTFWHGTLFNRRAADSAISVTCCSFGRGPSSALIHTFETAAADGPRVLPRPCRCCGGRMIIIETFARGCQPKHRPAPAAAISIDTS